MLQNVASWVSGTSHLGANFLHELAVIQILSDLPSVDSAGAESVGLSTKLVSKASLCIAVKLPQQPVSLRTDTLQSVLQNE